MTFREKYQEDFKKDVIVNPAESMCPSSYDYEEEWDCDTTDISCDECWDREIPVTKTVFLCDGKIEACRGSSNCYKNCKGKDQASACRHTSDVSHAKNFRQNKSGNRSCFVEEVVQFGLDFATSPLLREAGLRILGDGGNEK